MSGRHDPMWVFNTKRCREAMTVKGYASPYDVQKAIGIDHSQIHRLLTGSIVNPMAATLLTLADGLDVDPRDLMIRQ